MPSFNSRWARLKGPVYTVYHNRYNVDGQKEKHNINNNIIITIMGGLEGCKQSWEALNDKLNLT